MTLTINASVRLTKKSDWQPWFSRIKTRATRECVWEYINPDLSPENLLVNTMPQRPEVAKFHTGSTQLSPNPMVSDLNLND
ncbi:uncharacterized protein BDR25DRAFT_118050 [Lindgomyces ingoldianus]|uniref:Uncharacterized protein n=1 Tax=Lindgomyces ingoldianus TaxID=673940 RepID=A0ACB6Q7U9_9PLEO|nr:uncharacterized protein BDR25DRAFT_118050 [Lindgomyces ingoldianus]KAF2462900.1 hypothetical protein BDR25DRAFT_118050 [Lindgomyces ingoldianus]